MSLQNLSPACRPDNLRCTKDQPLHTNQYSVTHYERQLKLHPGVPGTLKFDVEPVHLTLMQRPTTFSPILHPVCHPSSLHIPPAILRQFYSCVGIIGGIVICVSWSLRVTDRMISVIAGPDDTGSLALPDSARTGGIWLLRQWTGGTLRARPSNALLHTKPDHPTTSRPTAASRARPASPRAPRCCPTHLTRPTRRRRRSLAAVRFLAARAGFQVHRLDRGSPTA